MWRSRTFRIFIGTVVGVVAAVGSSVVMWKSVNGPPFLLIVEPKGDGGVVQFVKPAFCEGQDLKSPRFAIAGPVPKPLQIALTSNKVEVPGGVVEFSDTTLLPGRFRIRFGERVFDVMEAWLIVDGKEQPWPPPSDASE